MPDFVHIVGQCFQIFGEVIVRVCEDKDSQRFAIHGGLFIEQTRNNNRVM